MRPRRLAIGVSTLSSVVAALFPNATMMFGAMSAIWRSRYGRHASTSSGAGVRLLGGRHFNTLAMYTLRPRARPSADSMLSRSRPACPTNGSPLASSSAPGASPTRSHCACVSPTPGTEFLRIRDDRYVEYLRLAGPKHQHAVCDDAPFLLCNARRITGSECITKVAERPRRGMYLCFKRSDIREIVDVQRPPEDASGVRRRGK